jgi:type IV secretory pathway protease TraF
VACPNCRQTDQLPIDTRPRSGDRILVRKHASPHRWELAVFRIPENPSIQYVARVVVLPGEEVELFGGDVFVNGRRMPKAPAEAGDMWLFVHDTGCVARQLLPDGPRWKPAETSSKWKEIAGEWTFSGNDSEPQKLSFTGKVTSDLAYNGVQPRLRSGERRLFVGDLMVECPLAQFSGEGSLGFQWEFQGQQVTATVSATGRVELVASDRKDEQAAEDGKTEHARGDLSRPLSAGPRLAFAVRDGQAYLLEDDRPVVQLAVGPQDLASAKTRSQQQASPCRIAIIASRCSLSIPRLRLFKDVYYCRAEEMECPLPEFADRAKLDATSYWMLGDNSSHSRDARFFGAVRKEAITGVPRWIYWPHARWHAF